MLDLLMNHSKLSEEKRQDYLQHAYEASQRFDSLLKSLLEWTREFEKESNIKPAYFDLSQMIDNAIGLFMPQILEKKLKVDNRVPEGLTVWADYNMLFTSSRRKY